MDHHCIDIEKRANVLSEIESIKKEIWVIKEIARIEAVHHYQVTQEHQTKKLAAQKI